jgi:parallel beta-helix repeat protein
MTSAPLRPILAAAAVLFGVTTANADTIHVAPGPGTPLQDAIDAAAPGDTVRLAGGGYFESIVITKRLTLAGPPGTYQDAHPAAAVIVAGCGPATTGITVQADGVKIHDLRVIEYTQSGIDVTGRNGFKMRNVFVVPNCPTGPVFSVNVVASTHVKIDNSLILAASEVDGSALHLGDIPADGDVRVRRSGGTRHEIGIFVDGCAARSVSVSRGYANFNTATGILLQDTDGIELKKNQVARNTDNGIVVDANCDGNRIVENDIDENTTDVSDAGTGNCWHNNHYTTGSVPSCP